MDEWPFDEASLTPVSDGTVYSAFSDGSDDEFIKSPSSPATPFSNPTPAPPPPETPIVVLKRKRGRPPKHGNSSSTPVTPVTPPDPKSSSDKKDKKLIALEALFDDPSIILEPSRRSTRSGITTGSSSSLFISTSPSEEVLSFHRACQYDQIEAVQTILKRKEVDINCRGNNKNTPLHEAIIHEHLEIVKILLRHGANPSLPNIQNIYPIDISTSKEITQILKEYLNFWEGSHKHVFLEKCFNGSLRKRDISRLNQQNEDNEESHFLSEKDARGNTGLHYAAVRNNVDLIKLLLKADISANTKNSFGNTPFHLASWFGSAETVETLLNHNISFSVKNSLDLTPINYANREVKKTIRRILRNRGELTTRLSELLSIKRLPVIDNSSPLKDEITSRKKDVDSLAGLSREERKLQKMLAIFEKSADKNTKRNSESGVTEGKKRGRPRKIQRIVSDEEGEKQSKKKHNLSSKKSSPKLDPTFREKSFGRSQLHKFASKNKLDQLKELLAMDKKLVRCKDNAGYIALHEASLAGNEEVVQCLLDAGSRVNAIADNGDTPLHDACSAGHLNIVKLLINSGADPNKKNKKGQKPADMTEDPALRTFLSELKFESDEDDADYGKNLRKHSLSADIRTRIAIESDDFSDSLPIISRRSARRSQFSSPSPSPSPSPSNSNSSSIQPTIEVHSSEPLLEIHYEHLEDDQNGWFYIDIQMEKLYGDSFKGRTLVDLIPSSHHRHLSPLDASRLIESTIMDRLPTLRSQLSSKFTLLLEREAVIRAFEAAGGSLDNIPVMYVELGRLRQKSSDEVIPPKLKMKWKRKQSVDSTEDLLIS